MQKINFNDIKYDTKSNPSKYIININNIIQMSFSKKCEWNKENSMTC